MLLPTYGIKTHFFLFYWPRELNIFSHSLDYIFNVTNYIYRAVALIVYTTAATTQNIETILTRTYSRQFKEK